MTGLIAVQFPQKGGNAHKAFPATLIYILTPTKPFKLVDKRRISFLLIANFSGDNDKRITLPLSHKVLIYACDCDGRLTNDIRRFISEFSEIENLLDPGRLFFKLETMGPNASTKGVI